MTKFMKWTGFLATLAIVVILPIYVLVEPVHQAQLLGAYQADAVLASTDLYAENCAICHGAAGEGIGENPPLDSEAVRMMSEIDLYRVIARGRDNTLMAGWAMEEGGVFSNPQIDDFVVFIQQARWDIVGERVAELGMTPPEIIEMEVSEEILSSLAALPDGEALSAGLVVYAENCAACHGADGAGTVIAPAVDSAELRATPDGEMAQIIQKGVPGTLMAGWENILTSEQLEAVTTVIYRWQDIIQSEIEIPTAEVMSIPSSPELITAGSRLYNIACKSCHGVDAYGTPMAPALNNQIFLGETPDAAIYQIIAGGLPETLMPAWGSRLTDQDIQSLVAFLRSLEPSAPAIVPPILEP